MEMYKDRHRLFIRASAREIGSAVRSLQAAQRLEGYRGRPKADIDATVQAIDAIQQFAIANSGSLLELDVNPLLIGAQGEGVFAADALIVLQEQNHV